MEVGEGFEEESKGVRIQVHYSSCPHPLLCISEHGLMSMNGAQCSLTSLHPLPGQDPPSPAAFGLTPLRREVKAPSSLRAEVVCLRKPTSSRICPEIWFQDSIQSVCPVTTLTVSVYRHGGYWQ